MYALSFGSDLLELNPVLFFSQTLIEISSSQKASPPEPLAGPARLPPPSHGPTRARRMQGLPALLPTSQTRLTSFDPRGQQVAGLAQPIPSPRPSMAPGPISDAALSPPNKIGAPAAPWARPSLPCPGLDSRQWALAADISPKYVDARHSARCPRGSSSRKPLLDDSQFNFPQTNMLVLFTQRLVVATSHPSRALKSDGVSSSGPRPKQYFHVLDGQEKRLGHA